MVVYNATGSIDNLFGTADDDRIIITNPSQLNSGDLFDGNTGILDRIEMTAPEGVTLTGQIFDFTQVTIKNIDELFISANVNNSTIVFTQSQIQSFSSIKNFGTGDIFRIKADNNFDLSTLYIQNLSEGSFSIILDGNSEDNTLTGTGRGEIINSGDGNDTISSGGGNDTIDAGIGIDSTSFSGDFGDYTIEYNDGIYTIYDNRDNSPDGIDKIKNVEFLKFADKTIINKNSSDNSIGVIENKGNVELAVVNGFYAAIDKNTNVFTKIFLKGDYITPNRFPSRWSLIAAERVDDALSGEVESIWTSTEGEFYYATNIDDGGHISIPQRIAKEIDFQQDLDGDGEVYQQTVESSGNTGLFINANGNIVAIGINKHTLKDINGNNLKIDTYQSYQIIGVEIINNDIKSIWKNSTGEFFFTTNMATSVASIALTQAELIVKESEFTEDFDNDGKIGENIETAGTTTLFITSNGQYVTKQGNTNINLRYNGSNLNANIYPTWKIIGAEIEGNDVNAIWKSNSGEFWYSTNTVVGGTISISQLLIKEFKFRQDFNGDGQFFKQEIEYTGTTGLYLNSDGSYTANNGTVSIVIKDVNGNNINLNTYSGYQIIAAEITENQAKVIWKDTAGVFFSSTSTKTQGGSFVTLTTAEIFSEENAFDQDLDGDGQISGRIEIESFGDTKLFVNAQGEYVANKVNTNINLKYAGSNLRPNTYAEWKVIGAEIIGNDVQMIWKSNSGQFWYSTNTNNGKFISGTQLLSKESEFKQDFNGNSRLGADLETAGTTTLFINTSGEYVASKGSTTINLKDANGNNINPNTYPQYQIIGTEITGDSVKTIWKNSTGEFFSLSNTTTTGGSLVALSTAELLTAESEFKQDFDANGRLGADLETAGTTTLFINTSGEYVASRGSTNINLKDTNGNNINANTYPQYQILGTEITGDSFKTIWKNSTGEFFSLSNTTTTGGSLVALTTAQLLTAESEFQQDFNGNSRLGADLETAGTTTLFINTQGEYVASKGSTNINLQDTNGNNIKPNTYPSYQILGAEITADSVKTIWKNSTDEFFTSTNTATTGGALVALTTAQLLTAESEFQQDFNGNSRLGADLETAGTTTLFINPNGEYVASKGSTNINLKYGGKNFGATTYAGWQVVGAEITTDNNVKMLWKSNNGSFWYSTNTNNGSSVSGDLLISKEFEFQQDFNGDGQIFQQAVESFGTTALYLDTNGDYLVRKGSTSFNLKDTNGNNVNANTYPQYQILGAEITENSVQSIWKNTAGEFFSAIATATTGGVFTAITSAAIIAKEAEFKQDFNGNGRLGADLEAFGSTTLFINPNGEYVAGKGSTNINLKYGGKNFGATTYAGWQVVGAEITTDNNVKTIWKSNSGSFWYSTNTNNGGFIAGEQLLVKEVEFKQDFTGDNLITDRGTTGNDTYIFNADVIHANNVIDEVVNGGTDTIIFNGNTPIDIDLSVTSAQTINSNLVLTVTNLENIIGGSGNDRIAGNSANNIFTGGAGEDTFVFGNSQISQLAQLGVDRITDFSTTEDKIELNRTVFSNLNSGNILDASNFRVVSNNESSAGFTGIIYNKDSGNLFYDNTQFAQIAPDLQQLSRNNFILNGGIILT